MEKVKMAEVSKPTKLLVTLFLVTLALGYIAALGNVYSHTHFKISGIVTDLRGSEEEEIYPKEFEDMVSTTHLHLFGHSLMFFVLCVLLLFTSTAFWLKRLLISVSFGSVILDQASMWLTRYVAPGFAYLVLIAGILMALSFLALFIIPLRDMYCIKRT